VYAALVAIASLLPSRTFSDVPVYLLHADKLAHFVMYGLFSAILCWTVSPNAGSWRPFVAVVLFCNVYGFAMEVLQASLPFLERTFSIGDWAANFAGSVVAVLVYAGVARSANCRQPVG